MNTLSASRPLMLVMVGLPGAGKSFFARQFAEMFHAPMVGYDRIRYELFADPTFSAAEHELVQRLVHYQIAELLKTKRSFIVDGGHNTRADRIVLEEAAKRHGYSMLAIWVQTDDATAKIRSRKRNPKHVDDQHSPSITDDQFAALSKRFATPQREGYVVISGKHAFSTQAKMVLRKLSAPHIEAASTVQTEEIVPQRAMTPPKARPETPATRRNVIIS